MCYRITKRVSYESWFIMEFFVIDVSTEGL
jgi:hypothetical protein